MRNPPNLLQSCLAAESGQIRPDMPVALRSHLLQVQILSQLHVLGVDAQNLQAADGVWDADVNLIFYK